MNKSVQQMGDEIDPVWASILASKGVWRVDVFGLYDDRPSSPVYNLMSIYSYRVHRRFRSHLKMVLSFISSREESSLDVLASQRVTY